MKRKSRDILNYMEERRLDNDMGSILAKVIQIWSLMYVKTKNGIFEGVNGTKDKRGASRV